MLKPDPKKRLLCAINMYDEYRPTYYIYADMTCESWCGVDIWKIDEEGDIRIFNEQIHIWRYLTHRAENVKRITQAYMDYLAEKNLLGEREDDERS